MFFDLTETQKLLLDELVTEPDVAIQAIGIMGMLGDFEPIKYIVHTHKDRFQAEIQAEMSLLMQEIAQAEITEAMAERETAVIN